MEEGWKGYPGKEGFPDRPRTQFHETHTNLPFMLRSILLPEKERRRGVGGPLAPRTDRGNRISGRKLAFPCPRSRDRENYRVQADKNERTSPEQISTAPSVEKASIRAYEQMRLRIIHS